jgi:xylitol oxidase
VFEVRTVAADDMWLSPCHGRDTIAFHFTWTDDDALVQSVLPALEAALAPFDARPHWAKVFGIPAARVRNQYPDLEAFRALAARYDPGRRFGNQFLEDFVYG